MYVCVCVCVCIHTHTHTYGLPWIAKLLIFLQYRGPWFDSLVGKLPQRRDRLPTSIFLGFPGGSVGNNLLANAVDMGSIPDPGRFPWRGKWKSTPVFLPGNCHGQRGLAGYSPQGNKSETQLHNNNTHNPSLLSLHLNLPPSIIFKRKILF